MPPVRVLSLDQVATVLNRVDAEDVLVSQAAAFHAYRSVNTQATFMPSRIDTLTSAIKIVSIPVTDSKNGLPGVTVVMDNDSGEPKGLVNARLLTAIRTAAGSALATRIIFLTRHLAQSHGKAHAENDSNTHLKQDVEGAVGGKPLTLVIFGSGAQAKAHIQLLVHVLPDQIQKVIVCNRTLPRAKALLHELRSDSRYARIDLEVFSTSDGDSFKLLANSTETQKQQQTEEVVHSTNPQLQLKDIVASADIICTCTNSREALFKGEWVKPGTHLNMVGSFKPDMHEVDQTLIRRAMILVDATKECQEEAGELMLAMKETGSDGILDELGRLFDPKGNLLPEAIPTSFMDLPLSASSDSTSTETQNQKDVTIFKSVGIAAQDVAITALVLDMAEAMNIGSLVEF
ncbi:hypothetical protein BGW38_000898 [Lunasporangiospora selenospora]|uniref:Ornithine cyclodeaminase n=1 Tax=Lunasporangiospora selenospora TaxID=979761 RepID=A0A9P6FWD6_9FUNG|nr:hypothetical protein BGW38_000898 [Lunasporangiospora selenospora]